jgi:hypothetical protein
MVEAAWIALEHHPHWKALFERPSRTIGQTKGGGRDSSQTPGGDLACADARAS